MNKSNQNIDNLISLKSKNYEKKSFLKEQNIFNINQIKVKLNCLKITNNSNNYLRKVPKNFSKCELNREITFISEKNRTSFSKYGKTKKKKDQNLNLNFLNDWDGEKESFLYLIVPNYLEKIIESTISKISSFNLNKIHKFYLYRKIDLSSFIDLRNLSFEKQNKKKLQISDKHYKLSHYYSHDRQQLKLCDIAQSLYEKSFLSSLREEINQILLSFNYFRNFIHKVKQKIGIEIFQLKKIEKLKTIFFNKNKIRCERLSKESNFDEFMYSYPSIVFQENINHLNTDIPVLQRQKIKINKDVIKIIDYVEVPINLRSIKLNSKPLIAQTNEKMYSNKVLFHSSKKRKLSEMNIVNDISKIPKLLNNNFYLLQERNEIKSDKMKLFINCSFINSFSRNGSIKTELISLCKMLIDHSIEIIVFDRNLMLGIDIILDSKNCCMILSPDELCDEIVTNQDDNKYNKIISIIKENLLKYDYIYILLGTNSNKVISNLQNIFKRRLNNSNKICIKEFDNFDKMSLFLVHKIKANISIDNKEILEFNNIMIEKGLNFIKSCNILNLVHFLKIFSILSNNMNLETENVLELLGINDKIFFKENEIILKSIKAIIAFKDDKSNKNKLAFYILNCCNESLIDGLKKINKLFKETNLH